MKLPYIHSQLPAEDSFTTVFHRRRPNLIKMKELHNLRQKEERMNYTLLKNYTEQERKLQRYNQSIDHTPSELQKKSPNPSKTKIKNFYYFALQSRME